MKDDWKRVRADRIICHCEEARYRIDKLQKRIEKLQDALEAIGKEVVGLGQDTVMNTAPWCLSEWKEKRRK